MAVPPKHNLEAYQSDTWAQTFRFLDNGVPVNLTSATVAASARDTLGVEHPLSAVKGTALGEVTIGYLGAPLPRDIYEYDVEVVLAGSLRTWVRGKLVITRDVTKELAA